MHQAPSPLSTPAEIRPDAQNPQNQSSWSHPLSGRELVRCCVGIDIPGAGWKHSPNCPLIDCPPVAVPAANDRNEIREGTLIELIFASRALAQRSMEVTHSFPGGAAIPFCRECRAQADGQGHVSHARLCSAGRVLRLIEDLYEQVLQSNPTIVYRKEAAPAPEPVCAGNGVSPRGLNKPMHGEPWQHSITPSGEVWILDSEETVMLRTVSGSPRESLDWADRVIASVNFCAAFTDEDLELGILNAKGGAQ